MAKRKVIYILLLFFCFECFPQQEMDTVNLPEVSVVSSIKTENNLQRITSSVDSYNQQYMNNHNVKDFKDFSAYTPSLFIPDYGSKITSTIYLRGLGSRIDNSSVGVCLDGVMLLNKNCFDFSYFDFYKIDIYKGAQSLTFGMNTMAGVIDLTTLSPFQYQGIKASVGFANGNTYNASFSYYDKLSKHWAYMVGADFNSTQGYFDNAFNGENCDWGRFANARLVFEYKKGNISAKNSTYFSFVHQGGYPYSLFDTINNKTSDVNYNDKCGYDRLNFINNTSYTYKNKDVFTFQSLTSLQLNFDELKLDNDFTSLSYFTLNQKEKDYAFSQEFIFKDDNHNDNWNWMGGVFAFYKYLDMEAPVFFKKDGIEALILNNANKGLHVVFPEDYNIEFKENEMLVKDNFNYPRYGANAYFQMDYTLKRFNFQLGLRVDYENVALDYDTRTSVNYRLVPVFMDYRPLNTVFEGSSSKNYLQFLPKIALSYNISKDKIVFASVSKGYMTGGFNTSMFADIIRNQMMQNMLHDLHIEPQPGSAMEDIYAFYDKGEIIKYKPQYIWDYELGAKLQFLEGKLYFSLTAFYIDVENQQLTIFLTPNTTGRMMTNAAKSRSFGVETSLRAKLTKDISLNLNYSYTNAKFTSYNDGKQDYKDKYLMYYPINSLSVGVDYLWRLDNKWLDNVNFSVAYLGVGDIYFNQSNTIKQSYYSMLNTDITLRRNIYSLSFWARNITNTEYNTFYFLSSGNNFVQKAKPMTFGATLRITL